MWSTLNSTLVRVTTLQRTTRFEALFSPSASEPSQSANEAKTLQVDIERFSADSERRLSPICSIDQY